MTLEELLTAVNQLSEEELQQLQAHIGKRQREARLRAFDEAVAALQEGLTPERIEEIKAAMNEEYVESVDVEQWRD